MSVYTYRWSVPYNYVMMCLVCMRPHPLPQPTIPAACFFHPWSAPIWAIQNNIVLIDSGVKHGYSFPFDIRMSNTFQFLVWIQCWAKNRIGTVLGRMKHVQRPGTRMSQKHTHCDRDPAGPRGFSKFCIDLWRPNILPYVVVHLINAFNIPRF